jgi:hypothetical protein
LTEMEDKKVTVPEGPKKSAMKIFTRIAAVFLVLGSVGFGLWKAADNGRKEVKTLALKQYDQITGLEQNLNQLVGLYKNSDSSETDNTNTVVLGASIAQEEGDRVLGLEDDPMVIKERTLMSKLQDGRAVMGNIRKTNGEVNKSSMGLLAVLLPKVNPTEKTEKFLTEVDRIYEYFLKSADRDIRSTALGFNLGVALQMAIATPDEPSIQRLESVITDFQNMVREEKNTDISLLPQELTAFHEKIVKADEGMITTVTNLPGLFRKKDVTGIKENIKAFLTTAVMSGNTGQIDLVTFWQGNTVIRQLPDIKKEWQDYSAKL